jgi:hypothetical protein
MVTGPTAPRMGKDPNGAPLLPVSEAMHGSENHALRPCGLPAAQPAQRARSGGGRNARANGMRSRATKCPLAIHPRELPAAASVTAIIVRQT